MTGYYVGVGWSAKSQTSTFFSTTPGERGEGDVEEKARFWRYGE